VLFKRLWVWLFGKKPDRGQAEVGVIDLHAEKT
jgi:hypothetical protein